MQIKRIVLYSKKGEKRTVDFEIGKVNIITGESKTGKTSIIEIIDYCLGSSDCKVAVGVIRNNVSWFGLHLVLPHEEIFIARENPSVHGQKTTTNSYIEVGKSLQIPEFNNLQPNISIDSLNELLTHKLNFSPNIHQPQAGHTRNSLEIKFRHALAFCFQEQGIIASKKLLFHKQDEEFISQTIKDSLPYLLGAAREDTLKVKQELDRKTRELKVLEKELNQAIDIKEKGESQAVSLIEEARSLSLLPESANGDEEIFSVLEKIISSNNLEEIIERDDGLISLQHKLRESEKRLRELDEKLDATKQYAKEASGYSSEAQEQVSRLESIGLFKGDSELNACALCASRIENPPPSVEELNRSLMSLRENLDNTSREAPRLREYLEKLEVEASEIRSSIGLTKNAIKNIYSERDSARKIKELNLRKGKMLGRISLLLDSVVTASKSSGLSQKVDQLKKDIEKLEREIDFTEIEERLKSISTNLTVQMGKWAEILNLEHHESPTRFDYKKLMIVIDSEDGPIPLDKMGSGENWVSYHLLLYFALQRFFIKQKRPVPSFIVFDQPSQVYYPPDKEERAGDLGSDTPSSDEMAVYAMYNLIFSVVKELNPKLQVIVTDHANLKKSQEFQSSIIEEWRSDKKLVPESWYTSK